jgi:hypothetical protein
MTIAASLLRQAPSQSLRYLQTSLEVAAVEAVVAALSRSVRPHVGRSKTVRQVARLQWRLLVLPLGQTEAETVVALTEVL